jgi:hypothetical protein
VVLRLIRLLADDSKRAGARGPSLFICGIFLAFLADTGAIQDHVLISPVPASIDGRHYPARSVSNWDKVIDCVLRLQSVCGA